jgi:hypothetical protein
MLNPSVLGKASSTLPANCLDFSRPISEYFLSGEHRQAYSIRTSRDN